ncbi:MAG TPA: hypothetical protein DFS52_01030 [Myxococcales bacterium]|jgi:hypothetical protein|nr:hypothetical protein [Myxococcales bacterium]
MVSVPRLALALAIALLPSQVLAASVYLNGTKVDGILVGQKMEKCNVEFDAKGDVRLDCPGIAIKVEGAQASAPAAEEAAAAQLTKKYFLVTEQAVRGATEFDIEVYVNSKFVRRCKSEDEQYVGEITEHLVPGKNKVMFVARKKAGATRRSFSPEHFFRVIIGEGNASGDRVMIDDAVITFEKTAAEAADSSKELSLVTR